MRKNSMISQMPNPMSRRSGLTLLELILVAAILAALAGTSILLIGTARSDAEQQLTLSEIQEIKKAVLRFKSDTGFLPKQGPFNLDKNKGGYVPVSNLPSYVTSQTREWFDSPANFWELYENPLTGTGHPLEKWNPVTGRGWRGPYLSRFGEGLVDVGKQLKTNGNGSPTSGTILPQVFGVADPVFHKPVGSYLVWRSTPGTSPHARWGRPYFLFDLDQQSLARIVSSGQNGIYEGGSGDDVVVELFR